jgi:thiamine biosynthesis lipoprotein
LEHLQLGSGIARRAIAAFGVEEGGFGKGIALRDAVTAALDAEASCVVIDIGGQVVVSGSCGTTGIDIAHPRRREAVIARLDLSSGSAATSGNSERGMLIDGVRYGHLLDPTTGRPAPDWGAVTVIASDPVAADCLATALFVMGPRRGAAWLRGRPGIEAVFAETDGESMIITATSGLRGRLVVFEGEMRFLSPLRNERAAVEKEILETTERKTDS